MLEDVVEPILIEHDVRVGIDDVVVGVGDEIETVVPKPRQAEGFVDYPVMIPKRLDELSHFGLKRFVVSRVVEKV